MGGGASTVAPSPGGPLSINLATPGLAEGEEYSLLNAGDEHLLTVSGRDWMRHGGGGGLTYPDRTYQLARQT
jgi:hypothetical protein